MSTARREEESMDTDLLQLLGHRFGDGLVYLREETERVLFDRAVNLGLVTGEGYLTPAGRALLAEHNLD